MRLKYPSRKSVRTGIPDPIVWNWRQIEIRIDHRMPVLFRVTETEKERLMKPRILGAAVAVALAAGPAMARHVISGPGPYTQSIYCATREAGNPFSKYCDYLAWSGWRRRGGWDSTLDNACLFNPHFKPPGCWP